MNELKAACTITAHEPDQFPREEPCYVQQQQDSDDTVQCSGDQALLNELLRLLGFDIPSSEQPEEYSTQIKIKPKDWYTNLNISFSDNITADEGRIEQSVVTRSVSISGSDFVQSGEGGFVDIAAKLDMTEADKIKGAKWVGTVYDADLAPLTIKPSVNIDDDNLYRLSQPVNGELLVTVSETSQVFDIKVGPREGEGENAYQSSMIVQAEGCDSQPTRYEIKVPECYRNAWMDSYGWPGGDVAVDDPPPDFVDQVDMEREWCLCGNHRLLGVYPKSAEPADISNICYSGPCDQITEPDCVPDDREDGEYC